MLFVFIIELIIILIIMVYIAINVTTNIDNVKMNYSKIAMLYTKEKVLLESAELYIEKNSAIPSNIQAIKDDGVLSQDYNTSNYFGGNYTIYFTDSNRTMRMCSYINNSDIVSVYLKHYLGREFGISPKEVTDTNSSGECSGDGSNVYHDFPLRIQSVDALP